MHHKPQTLKTNVQYGQYISYTWFHSEACYLLCEMALLGYLHENVTTIKLPNLDQTPLHFVWPWFLMMWQEYHVFGSTRAGESPEEGKEREHREV